MGPKIVKHEKEKLSQNTSSARHHALRGKRLQHAPLCQQAHGRCVGFLRRRARPRARTHPAQRWQRRHQYAHSRRPVRPLHGTAPHHGHPRFRHRRVHPARRHPARRRSGGVAPCHDGHQNPVRQRLGHRDPGRGLPKHEPVALQRHRSVVVGRRQHLRQQQPRLRLDGPRFAGLLSGCRGRSNYRHARPARHPGGRPQHIPWFPHRNRTPECVESERTRPRRFLFAGANDRRRPRCRCARQRPWRRVEVHHERGKQHEPVRPAHHPGVQYRQQCHHHVPDRRFRQPAQNGGTNDQGWLQDQNLPLPARRI